MRLAITASILALASALTMPTASMAQTTTTPAEDAEKENSGEIVVTATRRETDLQDTALSISALSGVQLEERGLNSVSQAIAVVPGVSLLNEQPGRSDLTVRGVNTSSSSVSLADVIVNSTTAVYLNQLPVTSTVSKTPDFRFVDMERVEVLRGPQGTLYGQSAMGGVIRYISNRPDPGDSKMGFNAYLSGTDGGGTNIGAEGFVNVPITSNIAVRFVGYAYDNSGYIDSVGIERATNSNDENTYGFRGALRWNLTDQITFDFTYLYHEVGLGNIQAISSTYTPTGVSSDNGFPRNFQQVSTQRLLAQHIQPTSLKSEVFNAELLAEFDTFSANVILGRKLNDTSNEFEAAELTGGTESYFNNTTIGNTHSNTAEFRLVSNYEDSFIDWLGGVYYEDAGGTIGANAIVSGAPRVFIPGIFVLNPGNIVINSGRQLDYRELAFYGEIAFNLGERVKLTGGYRYSDIDNNYRWTYANGTFDGALGRVGLLNIDQGSSEKVDTYRVNLEWKPNDDLLLYGQLSTGFRPGGFNPGNALAVPPLADFDYVSDSLKNYEIGLRSTWLDGKGIFNIVGYHIDWSDIQLPTTQLVSPFYSATVNAGEARIRGVEIEATIKPISGLDLTAAYAYTDAELTKIAPAIPGFGRPPGTVGEQLPGTAKNVFSGFVNWSQPIGNEASLNANLTYRHVSSRTSSLGDPTRMPSYDLIDARIGVSFENGISLTAFADNLTNKVAILRTITGTPFRTGDRFQYYTINRPRTIGVRLGLRF